MSEVLGPLKGEGFAGSISVRDAGAVGMITLRGDLASGAVKKAVAAMGGAGVPDPGAALLASAATGRAKAKEPVLWMSPDELLILCPYGAAGARIAAGQKALGRAHGLLVDVSDARVMIGLSGTDGALRDVLAKLSPADMAPGAMPIARVRRTRFGQVAGAVWFEAPGRANLVAFRSTARYMMELVKTAAAPGGEVGYHRS